MLHKNCTNAVAQHSSCPPYNWQFAVLKTYGRLFSAEKTGTGLSCVDVPELFFVHQFQQDTKIAVILFQQDTALRRIVTAGLVSSWCHIPQ
jgi:hypothetical protein